MDVSVEVVVVVGVMAMGVSVEVVEVVGVVVIGVSVEVVVVVEVVAMGVSVEVVVVVGVEGIRVLVEEAVGVARGVARVATFERIVGLILLAFDLAICVRILLVFDDVTIVANDDDVSETWDLVDVPKWKEGEDLRTNDSVGSFSSVATASVVVT